ncbi:MAG: acetyl-CoA carboxylase biotin carboxyl carrier protein subunit [Anaerolineae bacterium]|nr:acetyl-CoA carboxylase biotin carboxyl carrier protein subunit [Anaerolineae bacterium]
MSSYYVSIGEREYNVRVTDSQIYVNGEPVNLDLVSLNENGLHLMCEGNQSREVVLGTHTTGVYEVITGGRRVIARVNQAHQRSRHHRDNKVPGHITAPMPGLVVAIQVREGDRVQEGQILAVQEAMKMQMQLKAPFNGIVDHIAVLVGEEVPKDALILRMTKDLN